MELGSWSIWYDKSRGDTRVKRDKPGDNSYFARISDDLRSHDARLGALASVAARIGIYRDTHRLAREALQAIADLLPIKSSLLLLINRESGSLDLHEAYNLSSKEIDRYLGMAGWDECLEGEVLHRKEPILIEDVSRDESAIHYLPGSMSLGLIPLMSQDRIMGVLSVTTEAPRRLDQLDMEFLLTLGSQLGIYLQNVRLLEELEESNKQLVRQNQDLEELLSVISHDLRSPLATIGGYASLLIKKGDELEPEERTRFAETIFRKTRETSRRFDDLLAIFRAASGREGEEPAPVDVGAVIQQALEEADQEGHRERFSMDIPDKLPCLVGYSTHLVHIFTNLFSNAFKFIGSREDPRITVEYEKLMSEGKLCHRFSVMDNGIGIPEDYIADIFRPFTRVPTEEEIEGSGVGLASVQRIVRSLGGTIEIRSSEGEGTMLSFTLPWEEAEKQ